MESESNRPDVDSPWMVRIGTRGGFTGGSSGHVIHSDGLVSSFSRITPDDSVETQALGRATPETLRALIEALRATDLQALKQHETGNMTAFLEWSQGGTVHDYTWPERMRGTPLPTPLKRAYDAAMAAVNSARP